MTTIMSLPNEVIVMILEELSFKDIENFNSTCKKFRHTVWANKLWMKKFYQRWPTIKAYDIMKDEDSYQIDFKERVKAAAKFSREMWKLISQMYEDKLDDAYKRNLISTFLCANIYSTNYYILLDEVKRIFLQSPWEPGHDLTRRFYSRLIFRLLKHSRTRYRYLKFINGPEEQHFLERLVTIVVQWFKPDRHISYSNIKALLHRIARMVSQVLGEQCPTHPIFEMANEYYIYWENNNIDCSYWNYEEILPILFATEKIIFSQAYFHIVNQLWLKSNLNDSQDINYVSAGSQSIFLLTIYHSIMRRFGIYSVLIADSLQLFVKPKDNARNVEHYCLELRDGQFCLDHIMRTNDRNINKEDRLLIIIKLIEYLEVELKTLPQEEIFMLQRMIMGKYINISDAMMWHNKILKKKYPEERLAKIKFVIGTIVTHRSNDETHIGVIVGWNPNYTPPSKLGIMFNNFPSSDSNTSCTNSINCTDPTCFLHKPYYIILCENNMYCYMEQENVSKYDSPKWVAHQEIGRYFCRYKGNYYVPNEMLAKDYPSDIVIINEMMHNQ